MALMSRHCTSALTSACMASHRCSPSPEGIRAPGHSTLMQCVAPRHTPLYPVASTCPYSSVSTQPTARRAHVDRWATTAVMTKKYSSVLGLEPRGVIAIITFSSVVDQFGNFKSVRLRSEEHTSELQSP